MNSKKIIINTLTYATLIVFTLIALYPIINVFTISIRPGNKLLSTSLAIIPDNWSLQQYADLFVKKPFLLWIWNSTIVSFTVTFTGVVLASTAGYALSRFQFIGKQTSMLGLLTTQMFPATMLLLPMYVMLIKLQLINSYLGIIIIYSATALPFCIWQMKGYYDTIPYSLEESATIDGCNKWQAFYMIILPLAAPALVITALFSFMTAWSEYIVAAQVLQDTSLYTLPIGLKSFESNMSTEWGLYAAASLVVSIPVVILFIVLSKWLVSGLTLGSVKG
ncbi:MAG: sugar ABC transporter permease [Ignavibacteriales bacterium]|nr:sugar ABC transporter permease [Ignavibacteriales bacterium]